MLLEPLVEGPPPPLEVLRREQGAAGEAQNSAGLGHGAPTGSGQQQHYDSQAEGELTDAEGGAPSAEQDTVSH